MGERKVKSKNNGGWGKGTCLLNNGIAGHAVSLDRRAARVTSGKKRHVLSGCQNLKTENICLIALFSVKSYARSSVNRGHWNLRRKEVSR